MSFTVTPEIQQIKTQFRELHNRFQEYVPKVDPVRQLVVHRQNQLKEQHIQDWHIIDQHIRSCYSIPYYHA